MSNKRDRRRKGVIYPGQSGTGSSQNTFFTETEKSLFEIYSQNRNTFLPFYLLLMLRYKYRKYEILQIVQNWSCYLKLLFRREIERAPPEKTYQILNIKLLVCLGLCLRPENERVPPGKTYQILNIKLLVCLRLCLRSKNEICVHIIYDLWSRASFKGDCKLSVNYR